MWGLSQLNLWIICESTRLSHTFRTMRFFDESTYGTNIFLPYWNMKKIFFQAVFLSNGIGEEP